MEIIAVVFNADQRTKRFILTRVLEAVYDQGHIYSNTLQLVIQNGKCTQPTIHPLFYFPHSIIADTPFISHRLLTFHKVRGPKRHMKRLVAPKSWMLDKLSGTFAPRPSPGPHKLREAMPLIVLIRNRLKYALTKREVTSIMMQRVVEVDGKVRTDPNFPTGFMDVVSIPKTGEHFRIMYDVKGRFLLHRISAEEAAYKLCKVKKLALGARAIPYIVTHDGRTIRYPNPSIRANDTIRLNMASGTIEAFAKFEVGNIALITAGHSMGRIGTIVHRERHPGGFEIVHLKDARDQTFATRISNVFVIGQGTQEWVSLPKGNGIKLSIAEERDVRLASK